MKKNITLTLKFAGKNTNYTNTDLTVQGISHIQFSIEYHTPLQNMCNNQTDGLNVNGLTLVTYKHAVSHDLEPMNPIYVIIFKKRIGLYLSDQPGPPLS